MGNLDDQEDELYLEQTHLKKYAIIRHNQTNANSAFIVKYINKFGECGGFDFVMAVIDKKLEVNLEVLNDLINLMR